MIYDITEAIEASKYADAGRIRDAANRAMDIASKKMDLAGHYLNEDLPKIRRVLTDLSQRIASGSNLTKRDLRDAFRDGRYGDLGFDEYEFDSLRKQEDAVQAVLDKGAVESQLTQFLVHHATRNETISDNSLKMNGFGDARIGAKIAQWKASTK